MKRKRHNPEQIIRKAIARRCCTGSRQRRRLRRILASGHSAATGGAVLDEPVRGQLER